MTPKNVLIVLVVLVLAAAGWLVYRNLNPGVLQISPADGSFDVPRDSGIQIHFSHPMQLESVMERLSISPMVEGEYSWQGATLRFQPFADWPQGTKVRITLISGALTNWGIALEDSYGWSFTVQRTRLAYLFPAQGQANLYALDPVSGDIEQLTVDGNLLDFIINSTGDLIYYSATNKFNGSDLYSLNVISGESEIVLACQQDTCSKVQVSPDGSLLAYERLNQRGRTEIYFLNISSGEQRRISLIAHEVRLPQWAPNGWLTYYDSTVLAYQIADIDTGDVISLENQTGELGSWSPTAKHFLVQELFPWVTDIRRGPIGEASNTEVDPESLEPVVVASGNILSIDPITRTSTNLSGRDDVEDAAPVISPNGRLVAFARRILDEKGKILGRQLWLMRTDGSQQQALTNAPNYKYSAFVWHPQGYMLAAVRVDNTVLTDPPELWLIQVPSGDATRLVIGAYAPAWIP